MPGERVLVTGGDGFLGSHLVRRLLEEGAAVHVLVRRRAPLERLDDVRERVRLRVGDVTDAADAARCLREVAPSVVYHCAGDTSGRRFAGDWDAAGRAVAVNFGGTLALVRAAAEAPAPPRAVVRLGGLEEYGTGPVPYDETQRERPSSPYSASQVAATHWCQMLQPHLPFDLVTLRPALVYGPAQSADFLIPALILRLLRRERFPLSDASQHRDLLFVDDFVDAARRAADVPGLGGSIINVSSGEEHRVRDVALTIARQMEAEELLDFGALPPRPGELQHLVARNDRAAARLGWAPRVSLEEGLRRTIAWYRARVGAGAAVPASAEDAP